MKVLSPNPVVSVHLNMTSYECNHGIQMQLLYAIIIYKAYFKKISKIYEFSALYGFSAVLFTV